MLYFTSKVAADAVAEALNSTEGVVSYKVRPHDTDDIYVVELWNNGIFLGCLGVASPPVHGG
jgi:hypothetical protein